MPRMMKMIVAGMTEILVSFNANLHTDPGVEEEERQEVKAWLVFVTVFMLMAWSANFPIVN